MIEAGKAASFFDASTVAAFCSAIATGFAAIAAWQSPKTAARLAEKLRREAERSDEQRRQKLKVFTTLMQERALVYSENNVQALNSIDFIFNDSRDVREAWAELYQAFSLDPLPTHVVDERLRKLLGAIAKDIGFTDTLRTDDLGRVYVPKVQAQERFIKDMQRAQALAALQGGSAGSATPPNSPWPPKPE